MMNYEIFKEVVKEKFMDYMPEKFKGMELVAEPVEKVNVTLDGIILREEGRNISPTIYINDRLFDKTSYGKELIEVATELADRVIAQLGNKELEKAAVTVAEGVREYSTGKRGR